MVGPAVMALGWTVAALLFLAGWMEPKWSEPEQFMAALGCLIVAHLWVLPLQTRER